MDTQEIIDGIVNGILGEISIDDPTWEQTLDERSAYIAERIEDAAMRRKIDLMMAYQKIRSRLEKARADLQREVLERSQQEQPRKKIKRLSEERYKRLLAVNNLRKTQLTQDQIAERLGETREVIKTDYDWLNKNNIDDYKNMYPNEYQKNSSKNTTR